MGRNIKIEANRSDKRRERSRSRDEDNDRSRESSKPTRWSGNDERADNSRLSQGNERLDFRKSNTASDRTRASDGFDDSNSNRQRSSASATELFTEGSIYKGSWQDTPTVLLLNV